MIYPMDIDAWKDALAKAEAERDEYKAKAIAGLAFEENLLRQRSSMMMSERFPSRGGKPLFGGVPQSKP
jgi:hypothetical protein